MMKRTSALALIAMASAGCATPLSQAGKTVAILEVPPHPSCQQLGDVSGSSDDGGPTGAQNSIRNNAAALGANVVYVHWNQSLRGPVFALYIFGSAYRCAVTAS